MVQKWLLKLQCAVKMQDVVTSGVPTFLIQGWLGIHSSMAIYFSGVFLSSYVFCFSEAFQFLVLMCSSTMIWLVIYVLLSTSHLWLVCILKYWPWYWYQNASDTTTNRCYQWNTIWLYVFQQDLLDCSHFRVQSLPPPLCRMLILIHHVSMGEGSNYSHPMEFEVFSCHL